MKLRTGITILLIIFSMLGTSRADIIDFDRKVSLQFDEVPITTVLNMIAGKYKLNIVQSSQMEQEISVKLENVSLRDALNAILSSNGYNYYYSGDIVVVKPLEMNVPGELSSITISLNYLSPTAAVNALQDRVSPKGSIKVIEAGQGGTSASGVRASRIIITDLPESLPKLEALLKELDVPEPQLSIEVRMVETNVDSEDRVGLSWPTSIQARIHGAAELDEATESQTGTEAMLFKDLKSGPWQWGKLSVEETQLMLEFLNQDGNSKLISDPRITTLNNHEAEIKVTTVVPIQTINRFSEGGSVQDIVTFQDEEIGITLKVTPHICDDGSIMLEVRPTVAEIIGYAGPAESQKPITSERSIFTRIKVKNGETAVLGGLLKENKIETEQKVFILGSLPLLGNLFKHKTTQKSTTDLMIMISPTILAD